MPNVVKGSKQEKMVVVPYRPNHRFLVISAIIAIAIFSAVGGYFSGNYGMLRSDQTEQTNLRRLTSDLNTLQQENTDLRRQVAILDTSSVMDQRATEEVQSTILGLRARVAQLEQDIVFYRQVVSEETEATGLTIGQFDISTTDVSGKFRYKLVMRQQDADGDTFLTGHVNVNLVGKRDGEQVILPLREVSQNVDQLDIRLRFKFFQSIEGELLLPDGFEPERIQIAAVATEPVAKSIDQNFSWVVEGE